MKSIFSDCEMTDLETDCFVPGVFVKAKKPEDFLETDLSGLKLYNIVVDRRVSEMAFSDIATKLRLKLFAYAVMSAAYNFCQAFINLVRIFKVIGST